MTSPDVPFGIWCWAGPRAAVGVQSGPGGDDVLGIFLDPVNIVLTVSPFPDGRTRTARFLRDLARSALRMATDLDPVNRSTGGAHRAVSDHKSKSDGEWR